MMEQRAEADEREANPRLIRPWMQMQNLNAFATVDTQGGSHE
jgi:hypothetical protein